jgi:hypothetical protein
MPAAVYTEKSDALGITPVNAASEPTDEPCGLMTVLNAFVKAIEDDRDNIGRLESPSVRIRELYSSDTHPPEPEPSRFRNVLGNWAQGCFMKLVGTISKLHIAICC